MSNQKKVFETHCTNSAPLFPHPNDLTDELHSHEEIIKRRKRRRICKICHTDMPNKYYFYHPSCVNIEKRRMDNYDIEMLDNHPNHADVRFYG